MAREEKKLFLPTPFLPSWELLSVLLESGLASTGFGRYDERLSARMMSKEGLQLDCLGSRPSYQMPEVPTVL